VHSGELRRAYPCLELDLRVMPLSEISLQANTPLQVESLPAAPSQDAVPQRRTWLLLGFGVAGLVLVGVSLCMLPSLSALRQREPKENSDGTEVRTPSSVRDFSPTGQDESMPTGPGVDAILVQSGSLRTWTYQPPAAERVQVMLSGAGRPLDAEMELWNGPDDTHTKMRVYAENGQIHPFRCVVQTPGGLNNVAIRNTGKMNNPIMANVVHNDVDVPSPYLSTAAITVKGGDHHIFQFDISVDSVQILLKSAGQPLNARVELLQVSNPGNYRQMIELYSKDGLDQPFFATLQTPGSGNVIRIVNTALYEMPMTASVVPTPSTETALGRDASDVLRDIDW